MVNDAAYAACRRLAREHDENFPVASWLLPARMRPHVAAVYAFARIADDLADEGDLAPDDRIAQLDDWQSRLHAALAGTLGPSTDREAVLIALAETTHACGLDSRLFDDLVSAFRQDVTVHRYETWEDLLDYCRRSANPVGRLVLDIAGHRDPQIAAASDAVCTALQLTNFWQDIERDWRKGRVYVPQCTLRAHGAADEDLGAGQMNPRWRAALQDAAARTRALFDMGRRVCDDVSGRLRWELRATWLGGVRILDRLEASGFDVFRCRPALAWRDVLPLAWRVIAWQQGR